MSGGGRGEEQDAPVLPETRVIIARSPRAGWNLVRDEVEADTGLRLVGELRGASALLPAVRRHQPNLIVLATELIAAAPGVLQAILTTSPQSALVLLGDEPVRPLLAAEQRSRIAAWFAWREIEDTSFHALIRAVTAGYHVGPSSLDVCSVVMRGDASLALPPREECILCALLADESEAAIAQYLSLSTRRVREVVADLKRKLGVETLAGLAVRAYALGYQPAAIHGSCPEAACILPI